MSFSRHRHIFTLGTLRRSKRWQPADPFEWDPFKINSYNFRYAERPSLLLPVATQRRSNNETSKDCQTYFYNHDFSTTNNLNPTNSAKNKRQLQLSKYQDYRRRRHLNDPRFHKRWRVTRTEENSLNIDHNHSTNKILNLYEDQASARPPTLSSNHIPANNMSKACSINGLKVLSPEDHITTPSSSSTCRGNGHILGSAREININIKGLENNGHHENVNINIQSDSITRNLNIPLAKSVRHSNLTTDRIEQLKSSNSFIIDKRLSKFCSSQDGLNDVRMTEKERVKKLTSIYSSQMLNKSSIADCGKSGEQLPFGRNSFGGSKSSVVNGKLAGRKSFIQSVRDNLSVYDKASQKSCSRNKLHRSSYKLGYRESKCSNSFSNAPPQASQSMLCSTTRLPLNININLFADKL